MSIRKKSNGNSRSRTGNKTAGKNADIRAAKRCVVYLLLMLGLFGWLLFDTWIGNHVLSGLVGYDRTHLNTNTFRVVAFTIIAGGLGAIVNGIRSMHIYGGAFNRRYQWKYIAAPWMGSALALFVYALVRSSIAVLGGDVASESIGSAQVLSNFGAGALAGYGSKDVFIWLDDKVHKIFQVPEKTPRLTGKPEEAAVSRLQAAKLELGEVSRVKRKKGKEVGTVVNQSPPPDAPIDRGQSVDIAVAAGSRAN